MRSRWYVRWSDSRQAEHRLLCFPYAGGGAHIFRPWGSLLAPTIEVLGVEAPGKGCRLLEPAFRSVRDLVDALIEEIGPLLGQKRFSFFGHSNGALTAFEVASTLQARKLPLPQHLFLSASPAPWTRTHERRFSEMDDPEFKAALKGLNGTPAEVLEDRELLELLLPGLRADFALAEGYRRGPGPKLSIPTTVYYGRYDEIEEARVRAWGEQIETIVEIRPIPGGHFFVHSHVSLLTELIRGTLLPADGSAASVEPC